MSDIIYTNLAEHFNTVTYLVEAPEYSAIEPEEYSTGVLLRLYDRDPNSMLKTRATIARMIEMVDTVVQFKILKSIDIIEIFHYLNVYMAELEEYLDSNALAAKYHPKCAAFKTLLAKSMQILANRGVHKAIELTDQYGVADLLNLTGE